MAATSHFSVLVLLFLSFSSLVFSERCHPDDKKALLQIQHDLNNPYILISWNPVEDCCEWNEVLVGCDNETNRVTKLDISGSGKGENFQLPIPAAVGDLPYLQSLTFHNVNVTGEIPEAISKLSELNFLDLRYNTLTGPVPSFLGDLKELTYIGLAYNSLTGSIPESLGQLQELGGLRLDRNKLTGSIPESFANFTKQDFYLYLSHNELSGPIPEKLGDATFNFIDVSRNMLEGDISFLFGKDKVLNTADFSRNLFEFNFSKVDEFPEILQNLDLNHNKIYGSLPEGLTKINLISLNVSYNKLCGQIPVGGSLQEFDSTSYFHNKCLCGAPLPECK